MICILPAVPPRERLVHAGALRGDALIRELGTELREARIGAGLTQVQVAAAVGIKRPHVSRIERAVVKGVSIMVLARLFAVLGMRLSARAYPAGPPIRDAGHVALLRRLHEVLPRGSRLTTEVPVRGDQDGRAWDARIALSDGYAYVDAETRLRDIQAVDRRVALKQQGEPEIPTILLLSDTKSNRAALKAARPLLVARYPLETRSVLRLLRSGQCPRQNGVVVI